MGEITNVVYLSEKGCFHGGQSNRRKPINDSRIYIITNLTTISMTTKHSKGVTPTAGKELSQGKHFISCAIVLISVVMTSFSSSAQQSPASDLESQLTGGAVKDWNLKYWVIDTTVQKKINPQNLKLAGNHKGILNETLQDHTVSRNFSWSIASNPDIPITKLLIMKFDNGTVDSYIVSFNSFRNERYLRLRKYQGPVNLRSTTKNDFYYQ